MTPPRCHTLDPKNGTTPISAEEIVRRLENPGSSSPRPERKKIIIFTDIGRHIDDATLLVLITYLHKIQVVEVLLIVANVTPTERRAKAAKFICENMGVPDVRVATGSNGTDRSIELHSHEFSGVESIQGTIEERHKIIEILEALRKKEEQCAMIGAWAEHQEDPNILQPSAKAQNNSYDNEATNRVYSWLSQNRITTYTATRVPAIQAAVPAEVLKQPAARGHPVAKYIAEAFEKQEYRVYTQSAEPDPHDRYMEHMDLKWYAERATRYVEAFPNKEPESFEEIRPYLDMTLYDPVAGLICALSGHPFFNQVFQPHGKQISLGPQEKTKVVHYIIGRSGDKANNVEDVPDVNPKLLRDVMELLIRKALEQTMPE
ncbi:hypothetical protein K491DRAFT_751959 [Lophiostoma macrostomum CBS 122681]|uniref:Inosine/uridine-preferring nucleoside hydrolase domain-containing protein n=1 Tax=Lophiostoma macrostomum CBS 122681 TaxID=1314788 RepID=A0A6A6T097_9PLEO|nr:hypothetical protein K491DRAFT_751959 [Lophiostoma macrostomum CBS 122681]